MTKSIITPASKNIRPPNPNKRFSPRLNVGVVGNWHDGLGQVLLEGDGSGLARLDGLSLEEDGLALSLGGLLCGSVGLDTGEELVAGTRVTDVLDADVDALLDVAGSNLSVEDDTDGGLGHVVDDTSLSVVDLVGHTVVIVRLPLVLFFS